ncbi:unnamed protein product [Caenorhabditis angaria]|uniref:BTB domain-containing protein n=1 Tax=Caenorhabditis angaria TaxID=860376 RepID=A0A9P1N1N4_9PELO|nr:unnamed protein product [Caenorhabditis angaria]
MNPIIHIGKEIKSTFTKVNELTNRSVYGQEIKIDGFIWKSGLLKNTDTSNVAYLVPFLEVSPSVSVTNWICEVKASFSVHKADGTTFKKGFANPLFMTSKNTSYGLYTFMEWKNFYTTDYVQNLSSTISYIFDLKFYNFDQSSINYRDFAVIVGQDKFFTNKALLAMNSKFLADHLTASELNLLSTDSKDFAMFLAAVHPDPIQITSNNFGALVDLAHRLNAGPLFKKCLDVGMNSTTIPLIVKVRSAEKLESDDRLMQACIDSLKTAKEFKDFADKPEFKTLKDSTKIRFFTASLKFI